MLDYALVLSVRECNAADWYRDPGDHRCPHDAWIENLDVSEPASGARSERRETHIKIRLLGAYQDGIIEFTYRHVRHYSFQASGASGHGDWMSDEIQDLGESILHTILLTKGRFEIEAQEIEYKWTAFPNRLP